MHNIDGNKFHHIVPESLYHRHYLGVVFAHFINPKARYPFVDAVKLISSTKTVLDVCDVYENQIIASHS